VESLVTVTLDPLGQNRTVMTIEHSGLPEGPGGPARGGLAGDRPTAGRRARSQRIGSGPMKKLIVLALLIALGIVAARRLREA
jgi:hypothetical protein